MKTNKLATIIIFALALSGCKDDESPTSVQPRPDVIVPLTVNNQWTYRRTFFDSTGTVTSVDTFMNYVRRDTIIQGETWASTSYWGSCRNNSDGYWFYYLQPVLQYKYPAAAGDFFMLQQDTVRVVSTNQQVTVPFGTFACYDYQRTFFGLPYHSLVCPKLGLVRDEWVVRVNGGSPYVSARVELIGCVIQ